VAEAGCGEAMALNSREDSNRRRDVKNRRIKRSQVAFEMRLVGGAVEAGFRTVQCSTGNFRYQPGPDLRRLRQRSVNLSFHRQ
jgi:hypothetical protein